MKLKLLFATIFGSVVLLSNIGALSTVSALPLPVNNFAAKKDDPDRVKDPALEQCTDMSSTKCNLVKRYIDPIIKFLGALVAIAVTIGIISGGIRFASSEGDPQKAAAGKNQIRGAIIALICYIFLYGAINWLVPGGI